MTIELSHKILDRYVDGELSPREMENLTRLLELRPDWDEYVRKQELLRRLLRGREWRNLRNVRSGSRKGTLLYYGTGSRAS